MESNGKKRVRINERTTEIKSPPRSKKSSISQQDLNPLIPTDVVDEAFQRLFVVSLFVLIQSYKLYDLFVVNVGSEGAEDNGILTSFGRFSFVVKYSFIDGILLWFLPILNISYLTFSPLTTLILTLVFNLSNILLVSKLNISMMLGLVGPYLKSFHSTKELTVGGDTINAQAIDIDSHFKGKYTIHYLPDSLVKFNVFNIEAACQERDSRQAFQIPIELNTTTDLGLLELQYTSPQNQQSLVTYTESDINKLLKKDYSHLTKYKGYVNDDDRVFYIEVPAREPGTYKINKIRDKKGTSIRYMQNEFSFAYCPNAAFVVPRSFDSEANKICVSSKLDDLDMKLPLLTFDGVPPLHATVLTSFNDRKRSVIEIDVKLDVDLVDSYKFNFTNLFSHRITRNLLEQQVLKNPDLLQVDQSGHMQFQLVLIKDGLGNEKKYNPQSDSKDLRFITHLLTKPSLRLIDYDPSSKLIVNGTKKIGLATSKNIQEQLPLDAHLEYKNPRNKSESFNFTHSFESFDDLKNGIEVAHSGLYRLVSVQGRWCDCDFDTSALNVQRVFPPEIIIDAQPMMDKCVGMTGYNFKFSAQGEPPFNIAYSVYQNTTGGKLKALPGQNGRVTRSVVGREKSFEFNYKPPGEGSFVIVFKSLSDRNYQKNPIALDEKQHTYLTYFKQRSRISFFETHVQVPKKVIRTCQGESTTIPLYCKGNFPFTFDYSIIDTKSNKVVVSKSMQQTNEPVFNIDTKDIPTGGSYKVILANIVDGISCAADFNTKESIEIFTRSDLPTVEFDTSSKSTHHKIIEGGHIDIPVKVSSSVGRTTSDNIEYSIMDLESGKQKRTGSIRGLNSLRISEPGVYKLTGFSNGGCGGRVESMDKTIHVSFHEKPQLKISAPVSLLQDSSTADEVYLRAGCLGCKREVTVDLQGRGPFIIDYEITFPSGRSELRTMTTEKLSLTINLPTTQSGIYRHKFRGIFDTLYTKGLLLDSRRRHPVISYEIFEAPSILFGNTNSIQICEALLGYDVPDLKSLPVKLNGKGPYSLNMSITSDSLSSSKQFTMHNITGSSLDLNNAVDLTGRIIWNNLKQGEYEISVTGITDSNGCSNKELVQFNTIVVSVTPAPDITKFNAEKKNFCVGDHVGYDISGVPPFTMFYEFNDKQHKAKTSYQFRRLAAKLGIIKVKGLEDSSAGSCMINIEEESRKSKDLEITIHDLPSVEINQGDYLVQDIHEGEMTEMKFTFTGTPPFKLTYVRTLDPTSKARRSKNSKVRKSDKKITETTVVDDIWDREYKVMVGLEGTYEAIEIKDAFCLARKDFSFD